MSGLPFAFVFGGVADLTEPAAPVFLQFQTRVPEHTESLQTFLSRDLDSVYFLNHP